MSGPPRGPRGGRGPRARGGGRGGSLNNARTKRSDGHESDAGSSRQPAQRGRGRQGNPPNHNRGVAQAFQAATRQQHPSKGGGSTSNGGSRSATPAPASTTNATSTGVAGKRPNETDEQRFHRARDEREKGRTSRGGSYMPGTSLGLSNASGMVGLCQDMCSEYERARRIFQRDIWGPEKVAVANPDGTTSLVVDESKMVKRFARSAAGTDEQTATDLRPPAVLLRTADYLFNEILSDEESLAKYNGFIWDRTRAIRNDFSIQQVKKIADIRTAIEVFEKIARYHILSLHQIGTKSKAEAGDSYDWQQDREQLDKTLLSLTTYYDKVQKRYRSPNEAEFRAYWIVFQIGNITTNVEDKVQSWPADLLQNKRIQRALDIYAAASDIMSPKGPFQPWAQLPIGQQNWQRYWDLVGSKQTSYLLACVAEIGFNLIRRILLTAVSMTYNPGGKKDVQDWTLDKMATLLAFDDEETTRDYLEKANLEIGRTANRTEYLRLTTRTLMGLPDPEPDLPKQFKSWFLVGRKRFGRNWSALIAGMSFKAAKENGMMSPEWLEEARAHSSQDEGLFVKDNEQRAAPTSGVMKAAAKENPFISAIKPAAAAVTETKPAASNPFGQPSPFGQPTEGFSQPAAAPSPFGQPASAASPFGQPSIVAPVPQPAATTGSFGALPKAFSFASPTSGIAPASATPASTPAANPFAAFAAPVKHQPTALPEAPKPAAANPFAALTAKETSASAPAAANPFAGVKFDFGGTKVEAESSAIPPDGIANPTAEPAVAATPQAASSTPKAAPAIPAKQPKAAFGFPSSTNGGVSFTPKSSGHSTPTLNSASASPFTFSANPSPPPTFKPAQNISGGSPATAIQPPAAAEAPAMKFSQPFQPAQPPAVQQTPLPAFAPTASAAASTPALSNPPAQPAPKKQVSFAPEPATPSFAAPAAAPVSPALSEDSLWEYTRKTKALDHLAERLVLDPERGLLHDIVAYIAGPMIEKALQLEENRQMREQRARRRQKYLMLKYGPLWQQIAVTLKSRRKRLEMKKRNAEARQKRLAAPEGNGNGKDKMRMSIDEELALFKKQEADRRKSREDADAAREQQLVQAVAQQLPQLQTARTSSTNSFDLIGQRHVEPMAPPASHRSGGIRGHHRSKTQPNVLAPHNGVHRISKTMREASPALSTSSSRSSITRASLINGGSLADNGLIVGKKASTMQSPYFRLKAAGFGSSLKNSFTSSIIGSKRLRPSDDDFLSNGSVYGVDEATPPPPSKRLRSPADPTSFSSPVRPPPGTLGASFGSSTSSNGAYKLKADDEDLLARARRLRETLEESESWFKDERERDEMRQSQELRRSQLAASKTSSQGGSPTGPNGEDLSRLPKFYSRVSRFVPREEYGVRKEKVKIKEEPKGKEKANGNGQLSNGTSGRGGGSSRPMPPPPPPPKPPAAAGKGGTSWDDAIEL